MDRNVFLKRLVIKLLIKLLFTVPLQGQKYTNGTRVLKGIEVMSATPLQLDYVLDHISDTARITTNLHEGKTHLVLNDGSGQWREWWHYMGKWQPKGSAVNWENITGKPNVITRMALFMPDIFNVQGSPAESSSGAFQVTFKTQKSNTVLAAPDGYDGFPSFRELDVYTRNETKSIIGDTATAIRQLIKSDGTGSFIDEENNRPLMSYNQKAVAIPRTYVSNSATHTQFLWAGYENLPDNQTRVYIDGTGIHLVGEWLDNESFINTRSGTIKMGVHNYINGFSSHFELNTYRFYFSSEQIQNYARNFGVEASSEDDTQLNRLTHLPDRTEFNLRVKGENNITDQTDLYLNNGSLSFILSQEQDGTVREKRFFAVSNDFLFDKYLRYDTADTTFRIYNSIAFASNQTDSEPRIEVSENNDLSFTNSESSITLNQMIEKGKIYVQPDEPTLPENSFAFWVNGQTFFLIINANGIQKKLLIP